MPTIFYRSTSKCVLSLKGALALARARGLASLAVEFWFTTRPGSYMDEPSNHRYDDLDRIQVRLTWEEGSWMDRPETTIRHVTMIVTKERIEEHRNGGPIWERYPFEIAKVWATKLALSEAFDFPLESTTGSEWSEIMTELHPDRSELGDLVEETGG